jgi:hypothetical protein
MDWTTAILDGVDQYSRNTSHWFAPSARVVAKEIKTRALKGPINGEQAATIISLMPGSFNLGFKPLTQVYSGTGPTNLAPNPTEGILSWYWNMTQLRDAINPTNDTAILTVLTQKSISTSPATSVWTFYVGYIVPNSGGIWYFVDPLYLSDDEVTIKADGATFNCANVSGSFVVKPASFVIDVNYASGLKFNIKASSARGPTYEQSGGNVSNIGNIQNGYWSIVDGLIDVFNDVTLQTESGVTPLKYTTGVSWLDYQQAGLKPFSGFENMLLATMYTKPSENVWLFVTVQTPTYQIDAYIMGKAALNDFSNGKIVTQNTANVWVVGQPAQYKVRCNIRLVDTYHGTNVPSSIYLWINDPNSNTGPQYEVQLTSYATTLPYLHAAGGDGFESPSTVSILTSVPPLLNDPQSYGVIEWLPAPANPDAFQTLNLEKAGLNQSFTDAYKPNPSAQSALAFAIIGILAVITFIIVGIVYLMTNEARYKNDNVVVKNSAMDFMTEW